MNTNTVAQSDYAANAYTENVQQTTKKSAVTNGKTIGDPQLSEKAQKYYEQLKKKFSNMDFILVSADKKRRGTGKRSTVCECKSHCRTDRHGQDRENGRG